jgi:hypothetical protein
MSNPIEMAYAPPNWNDPAIALVIMKTINKCLHRIPSCPDSDVVSSISRTDDTIEDSSEVAAKK